MGRCCALPHSAESASTPCVQDCRVRLDQHREQNAVRCCASRLARAPDDQLWCCLEGIFKMAVAVWGSGCTDQHVCRKSFKLHSRHVAQKITVTRHSSNNLPTHLIATSRKMPVLQRTPFTCAQQKAAVGPSVRPMAANGRRAVQCRAQQVPSSAPLLWPAYNCTVQHQGA